MLKVLTLAVAVFLSACATKQGLNSVKFGEIKSLPPHMVSSPCRIYDINGKLLRKIHGSDCIFSDDGSLIVNTALRVVSYDKEMKLKWQRHFNYLHHSFRKSEVADELLMIESYIEHQDKTDLRSDVLVVMDTDGHILKSTRLNTLLANLKVYGFALNSAFETQWADGRFKRDKPIVEKTHLNSFYELYKTVNGKKVHTGYVAHCNSQKKILLLDTNLKKVTGFIDTAGRDIHDVHQLIDSELIFYQNKDPYSKDWKGSLVGGYDLNKNTFFEIYRPASGVSAPFCSSVQLLSDNRLFLTHSNCSTEKGNAVKPVVEYVDLSKKISAVFTFEEFIPVLSVRALDLTEFLKNNTGI